ncbi:MAG: Oligopeptide transport system permease protein AppB [Thermacetogenium phaeum]|jgi:peptide/nickel transport system permease protein|uniref:Oligopeptide transport system permease protein AppB n=1 Tax=Thermacetogenium phaeum TaxID=85874 RepID=A0A124FK75_9THEO|nr:MAG: Oligopeptide transport system permease protein AppB [Thermacetogenium phaeum]
MNLFRYAVKRGSRLLPLLFGISVLAFLLVHLSPIDPVELYLGKEESGLMNAEDLARLRASWGLDRPLPVQYFFWLSRTLRGDLGTSHLTGRPVLHVIGERLPATLALMGTGYLIIIAVSIYLGVVSAKKQGSLFDYACTTVSFALYSTPNFWLALILIYIFSLKLNILPVCGTASSRATTFSFLEFLHHLVLPALVLALTTAPWYTRFLRASLLEVLAFDFILVARAKGLPEKAVFFKHALRNALLPFLTLLGMAFPHLVGGSVVIETIFAWPGVGRLLVESALRADYPVLMGLVLLLSIFVALGNLLADLAYAVVDPRVRYGGEP